MSDCKSSDFTILAPETVETIAVPWYLNLEPIRTNYVRKKARKKASKILLGRDSEMIEDAWARTNIDIDLIAKVSKIISEECDWPNALFLPDDRCSILFSDVGLGMNSSDATIGIENEVVPDVDEDIWSELMSMSYGEFLDRLQTELIRVKNSDFKILAPGAFVVPRVDRLFPRYKNAYLKTSYSRFLIGRDPKRVEAVWIDKNINIGLVARTSEIIMKECQWPNALFVPDDKCSIIFRNKKMKLDKTNLAMHITDSICPHIDPSIWYGIESISYGEFMEQIQTDLKK